MKHRLTLLVVIAAISLFGCAKGNKLVGTWQGQITMSGQTAQVTQIFNADKTMSGNIIMELPQVGKIAAEVSGTWESTSETEVTTTVKTVKVTEAPAMIKDMFQAQMQKEMTKPETSKITWNGDDEMVLKGNGGNSVTFKRKK